MFRNIIIGRLSRWVVIVFGCISLVWIIMVVFSVGYRVLKLGKGLLLVRNMVVVRIIVMLVIVSVFVCLGFSVGRWWLYRVMLVFSMNLNSCVGGR